MALFPAIAPRPFALRERTDNRLDRLRKFWDKLKKDREDARLAAEFLDSDQIGDKYLWPNRDESDSHWARKTKISIDLSGSILSAVAETYSRPANRTPENGDTADWLRERLWEWGVHGLDASNADVDRFSVWDGSIAVEPRFSVNAMEPPGEGVEPIIFRRHQFEVLPMADPRRAQAVVLCVKTEPLTLHYWDEDVFAVVVDWEVDERPASLETDGLELGEVGFSQGLFVHQIGFLPIVFKQDGRPTDRFHSAARFYKLRPQCEAINKLWTEFGDTIPLQHGQPWTNAERIENEAIGKDVIIRTPGGQFGIAPSGANLAAMESGIQRIMDNVALTMGMSPGSIVMEPKTGRAGVSIIASQAQAEALRNRRRPSWIKYERQYHRAALAIYRVFSGSSAPDPGQISVTLQRPDTLISSAEQRESLTWQRENDLIDRETMLAEARPDLDEKERARRLAAVDAEKEGSSEPSAPVREMPPDAMPEALGNLSIGLREMLGGDETDDG